MEKRCPRIDEHPTMNGPCPICGFDQSEANTALDKFKESMKSVKDPLIDRLNELEAAEAMIVMNLPHEPVMHG